LNEVSGIEIPESLVEWLDGDDRAHIRRNLNGDHFTLTALPAQNLSGQQRAPVNGIQVVYPSGS
jgi:hypothetical protein